MRVLVTISCVTAWTFTVALLLALPAAAQVSEVESNDTVGTANVVAGGQSVSGVRDAEPPDFDYFRFTGLVPDEDYLVTSDNNFLGLGFFDSGGTLLDSAAFVVPLELEVTADESGEFIIGVCGHVAPSASEIDCTNAGIGFGEYLLAVPEPGSFALALAALGAIVWVGRRQP